MKYLVYKHTSPSGKSYIGITSDYDRRCTEHQSEYSTCVAFAAAIKKYGWDNFLHELLYDNLTLHQANYRETQQIREYGSLAPYGYNLTTGGGVTKFSAETRQKISDANRRRVCSDETRRKQAAHKLGKIPSEATKHKMSQTRLGIGWSAKRKEGRIRVCEITDPNGNVFLVEGLKPFCQQHNLTHSCMMAVASGVREAYKGWRCIYK